MATREVSAQAGEPEAMVLTRDFKETIRLRMERDAAFREALLKEGVECLLAGGMETGEGVRFEVRAVR